MKHVQLDSCQNTVWAGRGGVGWGGREGGREDRAGRRAMREKHGCVSSHGMVRCGSRTSVIPLRMRLILTLLAPSEIQPFGVSKPFVVRTYSLKIYRRPERAFVLWRAKWYCCAFLLISLISDNWIQLDFHICFCIQSFGIFSFKSLENESERSKLCLSISKKIIPTCGPWEGFWGPGAGPLDHTLRTTGLNCLFLQGRGCCLVLLASVLRALGNILSLHSSDVCAESTFPEKTPGKGTRGWIRTAFPLS